MRFLRLSLLLSLFVVFSAPAEQNGMLPATIALESASASCPATLSRKDSLRAQPYVLNLSPEESDRHSAILEETGVSGVVASAELRTGFNDRNAQTHVSLRLFSNLQDSLVVVSPFVGGGHHQLRVGSDPESGDLILTWTKEDDHISWIQVTTRAQRLRALPDGGYALQTFGEQYGSNAQSSRSSSGLTRQFEQLACYAARQESIQRSFDVEHLINEDGRSLLVKGRFLKVLYEEGGGSFGGETRQEMELNHNVPLSFLAPNEVLNHVWSVARPDFQNGQVGTRAKYAASHPDDRMKFRLKAVTSIGRVLEIQFSVGRDADDYEIRAPRDFVMLEQDPWLQLRTNPITEAEALSQQ